MIDQKLLDAWKKIESKASPNNWSWEGGQILCFDSKGDWHDALASQKARANLTLICLARNNFLALIAEIEQLRAEVESLRVG